MRLLEVLPDAVQNIKDLVRGMRKLPPKDFKALEIAYRATIKTLEIAGVANTQTQNQIMVNIFNNQMLVSPFVMTILEGHLTKFPDDPIEFDELNND